MNKLSLLAASVAIALTGCGGSEGDSSGGTPPTPGGLVITAVDGLLYNASVMVDADQDLSNGCELDTGVKTNQEGQARISEDYAGLTICVEAKANQTIDMERGILGHNFALSAMNVKDGSVASPMTHMVVEQMKADSSLTQEQAEANVVASITDSGLEADSALIFGNYLETDSDDAKALKIIGETLVDNSVHNVDTQLEITKELSTDVKGQIDTSQSLDNYSPVVTVNDSSVSVVKNTRPYITQDSAIAPIEMQLEQKLTAIDAKPFFVDDNGDTLTFSLKELGNQPNGLSIDASTGQISGTPEKAGDFEYQIFATDDKAARSYPLSFKLTVISPNTAPVINETVKADLQVEINGWQWVEGEQPLDTLNISTLFDDADSDVLSYRVVSTLSFNGGEPTGFQVSLDNNGNVSFDGPVPNSASAGAESLYVYAKDSVNEDEPYAVFALPAIAEGMPVEPVHPLEGKTWYRLDHGSSDGTGENKYSSIWCDSIRFEDNVIYGNQRTVDNLTSCSVADAQVGTYAIEDGTLVAAYDDSDDPSETLAIEMKDAADDISSGAQTVVYRNTSDKSGERYTYFSSKADTEKRLTIKSDVGPAGRSFGMHLPAEQYPNYDLGRITVSMTDYVASHDNNVMDANVFFDIDNKDFTCKEVQEFFYRFEFTGEDIGTVVSTDWDGSPIECFTGEEDSGPNGAIIKHAAVDFDLPALTVGNVYSIIGRVKESQGEYIEAIKFNIEWTGTGDTE